MIQALVLVEDMPDRASLTVTRLRAEAGGTFFMTALAGVVLEEEVSRTGRCNAGILMENQRVVAFQAVGRKRAIAVKTA